MYLVSISQICKNKSPSRGEDIIVISIAQLHCYVQKPNLSAELSSRQVIDMCRLIVTWVLSIISPHALPIELNKV